MPITPATSVQVPQNHLVAYQGAETVPATLPQGSTAQRAAWQSILALPASSPEALTAHKTARIALQALQGGHYNPTMTYAEARTAIVSDQPTLAQVSQAQTVDLANRQAEHDQKIATLKADLAEVAQMPDSIRTKGALLRVGEQWLAKFEGRSAAEPEVRFETFTEHLRSAQFAASRSPALVRAAQYTLGVGAPVGAVAGTVAGIAGASTATAFAVGATVGLTAAVAPFAIGLTVLAHTLYHFGRA